MIIKFFANDYAEEESYKVSDKSGRLILEFVRDLSKSQRRT